MNIDDGQLVILLSGVVIAFLISRFVAARWRKRRRDRSEQFARERESRQVRRARERRR